MSGSPDQPLAPLTALFVHGNWLHLLGNMLFLYVFGAMTEERMGRVQFAVFYLVTGYLALLGYASAHADSAQTLVGASGSISGVLGAFLWLFPRAQGDQSLSLSVLSTAALSGLGGADLLGGPPAGRPPAGRRPPRRRLSRPSWASRSAFLTRGGGSGGRLAWAAQPGRVGRKPAVITSIVLIKTSADRIPETAEKIAALENVSEVYSVTGAHDLIAMVRVARHDDLADIVTATASCRAASIQRDKSPCGRRLQHDLEAASAIGLDG
ncbi:hypothetical protein SANTM175S_06997 [Streptomyces antimycoticus]